MHVLRSHRALLAACLAVAVVVFGLGLGGKLTVGWGYGLFLAASLCLGLGVFALLIILVAERSRLFFVYSTIVWLFCLGGWLYVAALAALGGHYASRAWYGFVDYKWMLFGPTVIAAIVVLDWGLYQLIVGKNLPTWRRFGHLVSPDKIDFRAMRRVLINEVILHRTLYSVSRFRWLRHTLIFWGFVLLFATDIVAVLFREALPAFGLPGLWERPTSGLRLTFDLAFEISGVMVLIGCLLGLGYRVAVNGTERQKFTDTPSTLFLLFVVVSGFVSEGLRISSEGSPDSAMFGFVGYVLAQILPPMGEGTVIFDAVWMLHVLGSCAFIAYVPLYRLVHSCATPIGRLMNSQRNLLAARKHAVLTGLLARHRGVE